MRTLSVVAAVVLFCGMADGATDIELYHSHDFAFQATAAGNPFDIELAGEFTGPEGIRIRVPGFYDGDGRWIIRFSPTREGEWELRTASPLAALNGKIEAGIRCLPNRQAAIHGGLLVDPAHPYRFVYEDGTRYFLLGYEADWLWGADMQDPERKVMRHLIDQMVARAATSSAAARSPLRRPSESTLPERWERPGETGRGRPGRTPEETGRPRKAAKKSRRWRRGGGETSSSTSS